MTFTLMITCNNDAFGDTPEDRAQEIKRIIHNASLLLSGQRVNVFDYNGNHVGHYYFTDNDEEA